MAFAKKSIVPIRHCEKGLCVVMYRPLLVWIVTSTLYLWIFPYGLDQNDNLEGSHKCPMAHK